jgi:DNA-binding MarR family transcriptional regulator
MGLMYQPDAARNVGMEDMTLTVDELAAWRAFVQMQELLRARLEQQLQASNGLSNADYTVLVALSEAPGRRLRAYELCDALGWEKSRLHHHFSRMCRRGLVEREQGDARAIHVTLTDTGLEALRSAAPGHAREVRRLVFDRLTEAEVRQLGAISTCLLDALLANAPQPARRSRRAASGAEPE